MKRRLFLLFLCFPLLLCGCGEAATESTTGSDAESAPETSEPTERLFTNVSKGKPYTLSRQAETSYPDQFGQQLTDGEKAPTAAADYEDVCMVGFTGDTHITIDLGEDGKNLVAFSARSLQFSRDGVGLALSARFAGSEDGKKWTGLARGFFTENADKEVREVRVELDEPVNYRYIRVTINIRGGNAFFFTDEVEVFADVAPKQKTDYASLAYEKGTPAPDLSSLATSDSAFHLSSVNVAKGCSYTVSARSEGKDSELFDTRAPKSDTFLTDGLPTGRRFGENVFVGLNADASPSILLDLGKARDNLYGFLLYALGGGTDVCLPGTVDVYGSEDGKNFSFLGRAYGSDAGKQTYTVLTDRFVRPRYVRFDLSGGEGFFWVEELEVLAGNTEEQRAELYAPVEFPAVSEDLYHSADEPDYRTEQNLLLGLPQQIMTSFYYDAIEHADETPADTKVLTDGAAAKNLYCYGGEWFFHRGGGSIDFFYDLGALCTLRRFEVSLLEQAEWGIARPRNLTVLLSDDGNVWYPVAAYMRDAEQNLSYNNGATRMTFVLEPEKPLAARFVRFRAESGFLFIDELRAFGTKEVAKNTPRLKDTDILPSYYFTTPDSARYASPENTGVKAKDIVLTYGEKGDENTLLPFVAYLDEAGNVIDTLFDGFLYLPTGSMPSGNKIHLGTLKVDWEFLFDNTFNGVNGLDKLNEVVGQVKEALEKPDYKVQVYLTLLIPRESVTDFGDVDGDGVGENLSSAAGRATVLNWYLDKCISEFASRNYEHLELDGFYWVNESVTWEQDDTANIRATADLVHEKGSKLLWIPYYAAYRYELGYELGFDLVCMQPNYAFTYDAPLSRLDTTASRTKSYGMCVEIENTYRSLDDPTLAHRYLQYLAYGAKYGYMDATHIYYDDIDNYALMAYSESRLARLQYDATYAFIKGFLAPTPDKREQLCFYGSANTVVKDTLRLGDEYAMFTLVSPPSHGTVTLCENGDFLYFPDRDYTGEDVFMYTFNNLLGESETCVVSVGIQ